MVDAASTFQIFFFLSDFAALADRYELLLRLTLRRLK